MRAVRRRRLALIIGAAAATLLLARWTADEQVSANLGDAESGGEFGTPVPNRRVAPRRELSKEAVEAVGAARSARRPGSDTVPQVVRPQVVRPQDSPSNDEVAAEDPIEPIDLEPFALADGGPTLSLAGFDPYAPRELVAWRMLHGRAAIMSRGWSDSGGVIHFPRVPAPRDGFEVVVSEAGMRPELQGASQRRPLEPRAPAAPYGQISGAAGEYELHIVPNETTGAVLLADLMGNVFARYDVPADPMPSGRVIEVALTLPDPDTEIWMAHELPGGRVSQWRVLRLAQRDIAPTNGR